jgi:thioredoxin reductase (NADPH)
MAEDKLIVYGAEWCGDCLPVRQLLDQNNVAYDYRDIDQSSTILQELLKLTDGKKVIPVVLLPDGKVLTEPTSGELLQELKLTKEQPVDITTHDIIIIGAGPAALSAAIYTTREDIDTLLFERGVIGGLAAVTDKIDNYPGFPEGIEGLTFAGDLQKQAERFGAVIELGEVTAIHDEGEFKRLETTSGDMRAKAILIATGSDYKKVGVPGEQDFYARGVHYCATCDGAFYRDKRLVVIGGGNSAIQESIFLTRFASHIDLLVRSTIKASDILQHDLQKYVDDGKITVHLGVQTKEIVGANNSVTSVVGVNKDGKEITYETDGVFVFVGLEPNSQFIRKSSIKCDDIGFIISDQHLQTTMPGVFVAGDIRSGATMQIASATGEGATAALKIREYLEGHPHPIQN